jgi:hypothetical protein
MEGCATATGNRPKRRLVSLQATATKGPTSLRTGYGSTHRSIKKGTRFGCDPPVVGRHIEIRSADRGIQPIAATLEACFRSPASPERPIEICRNSPNRHPPDGSISIRETPHRRSSGRNLREVLRRPQGADHPRPCDARISSSFEVKTPAQVAASAEAQKDDPPCYVAGSGLHGTFAVPCEYASALDSTGTKGPISAWPRVLFATT